MLALTRTPAHVQHDKVTGIFVGCVTVGNFFFVSVVLTNLFVAMLTSTYDEMNKVLQCRKGSRGSTNLAPTSLPTGARRKTLISESLCSGCMRFARLTGSNAESEGSDATDHDRVPTMIFARELGQSVSG